MLPGGTLRGTLRGALRGTLRGTLRGALRGTLRGTCVADALGYHCRLKGVAPVAGLMCMARAGSD